ncbi:MAG: TRAP transporter fused permease subunit, partial [Deltaproteobacteria bacterium]|nr:TRAP transporter fused permease subunit [Deltaproteobacteria bacterium]
MPSVDESPSAIPDLREEMDPTKRSGSGWSARVLSVTCIASGIFHFYAAGTRPMLSVIMFATHLAFALTIVLWSTPFRKSKAPRVVPVYDMACIAVVLVSCVYVMLYAFPIMDFSYIETRMDLALGTALILLTLEASRRSLGLVFPVLVGLSICYALFGYVIPGEFGHEGFSWDVIVRNLYVTPQGFWGMMLQISATLVAVFLIFGAILLKTGGGEAFLDLSFLVTARTRGGPAKVAAVASSLFGMISGSAVANAATTGTFTIPMMKRAGFLPHFAAAVEAVASTGGMLMPPVMGAGAFLIAEFLGISYARVAWAAVLPALLYYAGVLFSIHLEAVKRNFAVMAMEEERQIRSRLTIRRVVLPLLPVVLLIYAFSTGYTVQMGAFGASIIALGLTFFLVETRGFAPRLREVGKVSLNSMETAGKAIAEIAVLLASAQIVVSMLGMTGLAVKFSDLLVSTGQQNMIATLFVAMTVLIILGMGVPPTAVYVLGGSIVVPA